MFLIDMADFAACNEVWLEAFERRRCPTAHGRRRRAAALGAKAEVELWAYAPRV